MPRPLTNPSIKCISLNVNKTAYDELIERGYDIKDLFDNLLLSLLEIDRESDIRYSNAKTAIKNLIDEKQKRQLQRMLDEQKAAELAQREKENKLCRIIPALDWIIRYISDNKEKLNESDWGLYRFVEDNILRYKDKFRLNQDDLYKINEKLSPIIKGYFAEHDTYNSETLKKYLTAKL